MLLRRVLGGLAMAIIVLALPLVLLLSNLYLLATPAFIRLEYSKPGFPEAPTFAQAERIELALASLRYLRSGQGIEALRQLEHQGQPLYNEREVIHLFDVKRVMTWAFIIHAIAVGLLLLAVLYVLSRPELRVGLPVAIFWGALLLAALILLIGLFAAVNFDLFFIFFHQLFFSGDSWLFEGSDNLIRLFPLPFWMDAATYWVILAFGEAVLVGAAAYLWPGWRHRR